MLIPFYLDEHFFDSIYFHDEDLESTHDNFLKFWETYGVLIYSENQSIDFYRKLIKSFPINFQQRWNAALGGFSNFYVKKSTFDKFKECKDSFNNLLENRDYFNFGLTDKDSLEVVKKLKDFAEFEDFQIGCLENYTKSGIYEKTIHNSQSLVSKNQNILEVWDIKFKNLTKFATNIIIIDRYLFKTIIEDMDSRDTSIKNFFKFLSTNVSEQISFTIISNGDKKNSEWHNNLNGFFCTKISAIPAFRKIIGSLEIYSVGDEFFKDQAHDRFLICDKHFCQIGTGFQIFRNFPISQTVCSLSILRSSSLGGLVTKAKSRASWKEEVI